MTTYLGKSCSFCLPRVPFVNCRQFMYLVISFWFWGRDVGSDCISSSSLLIFLLYLKKGAIYVFHWFCWFLLVHVFKFRMCQEFSFFFFGHAQKS